jgi:hypothetical protein
MNKKGVIGSISVMFFVTITVIIILTLFAFMSTIIKTFSSTAGEIKVYGPSQTGLGEIFVSEYFPYGDSYIKLVKFRLFLVREYSFEESLVRARTGGS